MSRRPENRKQAVELLEKTQAEGRADLFLGARRPEDRPGPLTSTRRHDVEPVQDFAEIAGIELLVIDDATRVDAFKKELRWNQVYYHLASGV